MRSIKRAQIILVFAQKEEKKSELDSGHKGQDLLLFSANRILASTIGQNLPLRRRGYMPLVLGRSFSLANNINLVAASVKNERKVSEREREP